MGAIYFSDRRYPTALQASSLRVPRYLQIFQRFQVIAANYDATRGLAPEPLCMHGSGSFADIPVGHCLVDVREDCELRFISLSYQM